MDIFFYKCFKDILLLPKGLNRFFLKIYFTSWLRFPTSALVPTSPSPLPLCFWSGKGSCPMSINTTWHIKLQ